MRNDGQLLGYIKRYAAKQAVVEPGNFYVSLTTCDARLNVQLFFFFLVLVSFNSTYLQECGLAGSLLQSCDGNGKDLFRQPWMRGGMPPATEGACNTTIQR